MIKVRFNSDDEFLEELKTVAAYYEGHEKPVVRVTQLFSTSKFSPCLRHVEVVAGCVVTRGVGLESQLIELRTFVGDYWNTPTGVTDEISEQTRNRAKNLVDKLSVAIRELDMGVRAGMFEDAEAKG